MASVVPRTKITSFDVRRVDEVAHALARAFVGVGRARRELMRRAMDVRVLVLVEVRDAVDHRLRLVRGGRVVEPHQLLAVDALLQDREVAAHGVDVERRMRPLPASGTALGPPCGSAWPA
jgi:hypothetical protein